MSKYKAIVWKIWIILLLVGILFVRIWHISKTPGLFSDEAMGGYNSWSLANYGTDMWGNHNPVYLIAWGSGMNVLYPLIAVPFIKIMGLSVFSYRLPMIIISTLVAVFSYFSFRKAQWSRWKISLTMVSVFLSPLMIMISRTAVESNLLPYLFILLFDVSLFLLNTQSEVGKRASLIGLVLVFGAMAYTYSSVWFVLPFLVLGVVGLLLKRHVISFKEALVSFVMLAIFVSPLLAFVARNYLHVPIKHFLFFSIPQLFELRSDASLVHGGIRDIISNMLQNMSMIYQGFDNHIWNSIPGISSFFGTLIMFSAVGFLWAIKKWRDSEYAILIIMFLSAVPLSVLITPSLTHQFSLIPTLLILEGIGFALVAESNVGQQFAKILSIILLIQSVMFVSAYQGSTLKNDDGNIVTPLYLKSYLAQQKGETYFSGTNNPYIYQMFYDPLNPKLFYSDSLISRSAFSNVSRINKRYYDLDNHKIVEKIKKDGLVAIVPIQQGKEILEIDKTISIHVVGRFYIMGERK